MEYKILIKPEAETEIREAYSWYKDEKEHLGDSFLEALDNLFLDIVRNPNICSVRYRNIRMGLTNRFPYAVHCIVESDTIVVLAVLHTKRKPRT